MNLSKLIHEVWKDSRVRALKLRKGEVRILVEVMIEKIGDGLLKHGKMKLQNLFTLHIRKAKGRRIGHPITKEPMEIDSYFKIGIEPSKRLRAGLKGLKESENEKEGENV